MSSLDGCTRSTRCCEVNSDGVVNPAAPCCAEANVNLSSWSPGINVFGLSAFLIFLPSYNFFASFRSFKKNQKKNYHPKYRFKKYIYIINLFFDFLKIEYSQTRNTIDRVKPVVL